MTQALEPLIGKAREGDRAALNQLAGCVDRFVRVHSGSLSRHVRNTHGSTIDFVLEGLAEALSNLDQLEYRSDEQFYAWISRIIQNRIQTAGRSEGTQKRAGRPVSLAADERLAPADDVTPSQIISNNEVRSVLADALIELQLDHPDEMEAVLLKTFEGYSWPMIQDWMRLSSPKRARTLFARGIDLLRPHVAKRIGESAFQNLLSS